MCPAVGSSPYDTAEQVLELARSVSNDAALSLVGDILADSQPYTYTLLQSAYEDFQDRMAAQGANTYKKYGIVTGLTPVANPGGVADPTIQVQLSYTGYYDGVTNHSTPTLPADLLEPLEVWERQTGTVNRWSRVLPVADAITTSSQNARFGEYDWESDILYLPGATLSNDLKFKYIPYMPQLTGPSSQVFYVKAKNAIAYLMVAAASAWRGGIEIEADYTKKAVGFIERMVSRQSTKDQYTSSVRRPFRGRGGRRRVL